LPHRSFKLFEEETKLSEKCCRIKEGKTAKIRKKNIREEKRGRRFRQEIKEDKRKETLV